jgi:hypothetical protein
MMRLTRSNPSCAGWRSPRCRAAAGRASAQSSLSAAPGAPVAVSLAGQLVTAVRAPCVRDARHVQREVESTRRFHVVRRFAKFAPFRSCSFTTWLASGAAPTPGQRGPSEGEDEGEDEGEGEGKIKGNGTGRRESIEKSKRHRGAQLCTACRFLRKGPQIQRSRRHHAIEQTRQSGDCASRRAFRSFHWPSMIPGADSGNGDSRP